MFGNVCSPPGRAVPCLLRINYCGSVHFQTTSGFVRHRLVQKTRTIRKTTTRSSTETSGLPGDPNAADQQNIAHSDGQPVVQDVHLSTYHYVTFFLIMAGGLFFVSVLLYFSADINFMKAVSKVWGRLTKTVALPQLGVILSAMAFVNYGLEPLIKTARRLTKAQGPYEKSSEYYILREVYKPLEFLFLVAAVTTIAENFLPQLVSIPKSMMQTFVRSTLSLTFVIAAAQVVFNIKSRIVRESSWQLELKGDLTRQRRLEAVDKLTSLATIVVCSIFAVKSLGMDIRSVLAIGGVGGVAAGLAGREILENLFTGLIILSSNPFEVGEEVLFRPSSGQVVEGIVVDVGWYRTTIRSFEREIYIIPNSVFSRNVVLNITRKQREWRFYEFLHLRLEDLLKASAVVSDIRKILRQDGRIIQKLHRRVFLDKVTKEDATIYISFYVEATNRDAFMAVKQDLLLAFIDCVERNGARLARNKLQLEMLPTLPTVPVGEPFPIVDVPALPQPEDTIPVNNSNINVPPPPSPPSPPPSSPGDGQQQQKQAQGVNNVVAGAPSTTPASKPSTPMNTNKSSSSSSSSTVMPPSPQVVAAAMANSPIAGEKIRSIMPGVINPDKIVGGIQTGSIVVGSFDDQDCDA